jgi:hypothetical protein
MFLVECDEKWGKCKEIMQFFLIFLVECDEKWRKCKEIMQFFECFLLNGMKNEENKGNNPIFWKFLVECDKN